MYTPYISHIYDDKGKRQTIDMLLNDDNGKQQWEPALSNEWGRLAKSNARGVACTDTIEFVYYHQVPQDHKVTYATFACDY